MFWTIVLVSFMLASSVSADEMGDLKKQLRNQSKTLKKPQQTIADLEAKQRLDKKKAVEPKTGPKEPGNRPTTTPSKPAVFWKEGLRIETADGAFRGKIGGRIQNDWP